MQKFNTQWFNPMMPIWERHVIPNLPKTDGLNWLEIGSHEGQSACWTLDNVLKHDTDRIVCVDLWRSKKTSGLFDQNTSQYGKKLLKIKHDCLFVLMDAINSGEKYDGIYIDADHQAKSVVLFGLLAFKLLKLNGIMIFDDYRWQQPDTEKLSPGIGVDCFLTVAQKEIKVLYKDKQAIVQKIKENECLVSEYR